MAEISYRVSPSLDATPKLKYERLTWNAKAVESILRRATCNHGRYTAEPFLLSRGRLADLEEGEIARCLDELESAEMIQRYEAGGEAWLWFPDTDQMHSRRYLREDRPRSPYPPPPGYIDPKDIPEEHPGRPQGTPRTSPGDTPEVSGVSPRRNQKPETRNQNQKHRDARGTAETGTPPPPAGDPPPLPDFVFLDSELGQDPTDSTLLATEPDTPKAKKPKPDWDSSPKARMLLFEHWARLFRTANAKMQTGDKRDKAIASMLRHYPPEDLKASLDGYASDEWRKEKPERNELATLFRDSAHVETGLEAHRRPKNASTTTARRYAGGFNGSNIQRGPAPLGYGDEDRFREPRSGLELLEG